MVDTAFDAMQNGLAYEDFSEAWNLMNDIVHPMAFPIGIPDSAADESTDHLAQGDIDGKMANSAETETRADKTVSGDYAFFAASTFEDLLRGCIV